MGNAKSSSKFKKFAIAFLKEAKEDLEVAEELLESKRYARSVYSSQQSVEKAIKALLETEKIFVSEHNLSRFFVKFIYNNKNYSSLKKQTTNILKILDYFEGEWSRTRYPKEVNGRVLLPMEIYKSQEAEDSYYKATQVYDIIKEIFIKKLKIKV